MEAKNFRIGNLVRSKVNGIAKVCQVGISTNPNYMGGRCLNGNYWENSYLPIEINAKWLENLGFKELDFVEVADRMPNLIKHRFDTPFGEVEITPRIGGEEFTFWWDEGNITTVKYVHELQNLFFAITGQELELKYESEQLHIHLVMPSLDLLNFKKMRKSKGLTLMQVEEITGISNGYLSQLENKKIKAPSYNAVRKLYILYNEA